MASHITRIATTEDECETALAAVQTHYAELRQK